MRMSLLALLMLMAVAAGCAVSRPADAVALSLYTRNLSEEAFAFTVVGSHSPPVLGETGDAEPRSYGCGWVGSDWQLIVAQGSEPPEPADDFAAMRSGEDYGQPQQLALWIEVGANGEVSIGEGVPHWWRDEEQRCG